MDTGRLGRRSRAIAPATTARAAREATAAASGTENRPRPRASTNPPSAAPPALPRLKAPIFSVEARLGASKAMCELLLADYSRRGFLDGIALRLPTICVRPGKPNAAAPSFYSSIIREPLIGQDAVLPVSRDLRHWFASPRSAVNSLIHAASIDLGVLGARRGVNLPGVSATVADQIKALSRLAGDHAVSLIHEVQDASVQRSCRPGLRPSRQNERGAWASRLNPPWTRSFGCTSTTNSVESPGADRHIYV